MGMGLRDGCARLSGSLSLEGEILRLALPLKKVSSEIVSITFYFRHAQGNGRV